MTKNPAYENMDNSVIDAYVDLLNLNDDQWTSYKEPKKDNDPLIWGWKSVQKGATSTEVFMKLKFVFPDTDPEAVFNGYHPKVRSEWEGLPKYEILEYFKTYFMIIDLRLVCAFDNYKSMANLICKFRFVTLLVVYLSWSFNSNIFSNKIACLHLPLHLRDEEVL